MQQKCTFATLPSFLNPDISLNQSPLITSIDDVICVFTYPLSPQEPLPRAPNVLIKKIRASVYVLERAIYIDLTKICIYFEYMTIWCFLLTFSFRQPI